MLLGNLREHGTRLGDHPNSGNFKILTKKHPSRKADQIVQALVLTRRGNLLLSPGPLEPAIRPLWLEAVTEEKAEIRTRGCLAEWSVAREAWSLLASNGIVQKNPQLISQEILFELFPIDPPEVSGRGQTSAVDCLRLTPADFEEWKPLRLAYWEEEGVPTDLNDQQLRDTFEKNAKAGRAYGARLRSTGALLSISLLVSMVDLSPTRAGQVGGVYTHPDHRELGYAKSLMRFMLKDSHEKHRIDRLSLFTARGNTAAQSLYRGLGFRDCGEFGIFLDS